MFQKAVKSQAKLRLAIDGPSGSGKTYTALMAASAMANGGKIAVIDTERGSASLYADKFDFDAATLDNFNPQNYINLISAAEKAGYDVIVIDSLSHAWEGEGGALDLVDEAARRSRSGNTFTAWKDVTPLHRRLVDAMLQSKCHIIATMRSKTEYVVESVERNGKTVQMPKKVGMAPIQRQGMEYEFTIVGDMDLDHNLIITKSRMSDIADAAVNKPGKEWFEQVRMWLKSGTPALERLAPPIPSQEPIPQPEPEKPSTNGSGPRPFSPQQVRDNLIIAIDAYDPTPKPKGKGHSLSEQARKMIPVNLEKCFAGDANSTEKRHTVVFWLFGYESTKEFTDAEAWAVNKWLNPQPDTGGDWSPCEDAIKEAQAIWREATTAEGQQELF